MASGRWKFVWSQSGYRSVLNSSGVQTMVRAAAKQKLNAANASLTKPHGYHISQFDMVSWTGSRGYKGYTVYPHSLYAQRHARKHGMK